MYGIRSLRLHTSRLTRPGSVLQLGFSRSANPQIPMKALVSRTFHSTPLLKQQSAEFKKEVEKLRSLKKQFEEGNLLDKLKLGTELSAQEQVVLNLYKSPEIKPVNTLDITLKNPLDKKSAERYKLLAVFLSQRFISEVANAQNGIYNDKLAATVAADFNQLYSTFEPASEEEVATFFESFFRILNFMNPVEDLKFLSSTIQDLFISYNELENDSSSLKNPDLAPEAVADWCEVFRSFLLLPYATDAQKLVNPLVPEKSDLQKLRELLDDHDSKHQFTKFPSPGFNSNTSESSKDPKKKPDEYRYIDFDITSQNFKLFFLGAGGGLLFYLLYSSGDGNHEISFQEFTADYLRKNFVSKIRVINNRTALIELNENGKSQLSHPGHAYFTIGSVESFERNLLAVQSEFEIPDQLRIPVVYVTEGSIAKVLVNFLPTFLFLGAIYYMTKKASMGGMGGPLGFGKSTAKKFNQEKDIKTKFKDVAGMDEAKEEVMEFVKFLQNPSKYQKLGAKIPRGAILSGPPGTGKTLIAKATAGEAGVPFYSVSGSEFVEMFVGVGASRVRDLFKTARENAPSIIFVDEIDAIGKQRSKGNASGSNDERETTLNQLLVEMDGFETSDHVVVLAGTNRADILDRALMRPGRFDRHISIDNPELKGRKEIFDVHLKKITLSDTVGDDLSGRLAALTPGFSGADIANVCNESALIAARYNAKSVSLRHFELAIERVIGGVEKKSKLLAPDEKKVVAYHEAGHAVCGWFLKHAHPLLKVSIIPRGQGALGYAQYLPPDQYLMSEAQLSDRMVMTLGGRVSEQLKFSSVTSGAYDDFKKVTAIAQSMVMRFGMSPRVGMVNYADTQSQDSLTKPFSDETNNIIDEEIKRIVKESQEKCRELLTEKSKEVELVAQELLKKEFITREDMIRLLGKRPFPETNDAFDKYLDGKDAFKNEKPADEKKDDEL